MKIKVWQFCLLIIALVMFNLFVGGWSVGYIVFCLFAKDVSWLVLGVAGFFFAQFTIPIAVVCWVITLCGITTPWIR